MQERMLIATHNSGTGESPKGLLSYLLTPFARCQSKTIEEQYDAGCRFFDIRLRYVDGVLKFAHKPWVSKKGIYDILPILANKPEKYAIGVMYEGSLTDEELAKFEGEIKSITEQYNIDLAYFGVRTPWKVHYENPDYAYDYGFQPLNPNSWHMYIPIPWMWNKIKGNHKFNTDKYLMVDFL